MEFFLPISYLNDFVFCPYSIYLHQVYDNNFTDTYSAKPQEQGKRVHSKVDRPHLKNSKRILSGAYVISNRLGVYGKIDQYYLKERKLVERKYNLKKIFRGYYYQIWAQYLALEEMGHPVDSLYFQSIKKNERVEVEKPNSEELNELRTHIKTIARFDFENEIKINPQKCTHCIYASLCDKTNKDHVYA
ncbi:type V CRISPR-associated protein Cas4 [Brumimicrobium aurantiacum]|uniref:Type V CRISPR-associated protein Cas4 n=1 Tax=Brumimicrobium aurantiacum TaxID=1737063 RepID=A0A3E1EYK2_9FLAO|nr:type V CRISPR-associated protein Cas4 [Brumimicrobium aurantiacum]RFC54640.1 type V CRISPR-associated protein Cas4 [Brumimicrobium aurantiacum]